MSAERRIKIIPELPLIDFSEQPNTESEDLLDHVTAVVRQVIRHEGTVPLRTRLEMERILYKAREIIIHESMHGKSFLA